MNIALKLQKGISLVEVLVTVIVFAIGLLAIAQLQGELVRSGADAKTRTVGVSLAEERLEQFRSFTLDTGSSYSDIVDRPKSSAITETISGVDYEIWWEVEDYHFDSTGVAVLGVPAGGTSDFKMIRVRADWVDERGNAQNVFVEDIVSKSPPSDVLLTIQGSPPAGQPIVRYRDVLTAPEVIQVDLGDGFSKQTAKPEPKVVGLGPNIKTEFETITFSNNLLCTDEEAADGNQCFPRQRLREQFLSINCRCTQQTEEGPARTPAQWNGARWVPGREVTKRVGTPVAGLEQPFICNRCCRDHHDVTGEESFDPFRPQGDDANGNPFFPSGLGGDHGHFAFDPSNGQLIPADSTGAEYLEACTFTRVEGIFQAVPDFRLESLAVIPTEFLQFQAGISTYQSFVQKFVEEYVGLIDPDQYPQQTPNLNLNETPNDASGELQSLWDSIPNPDPIAPPAEGSAEGRQLLARAIYVNYINPELLQRIKEESGSVLPLVPFQEVNVTRLATWDDGASTSIYVTKDALTSDNAETFDRGRAIHCATYTPTDGSGTVAPRCDKFDALITASLFRSNTGLLANANPVDTDDGQVRADSILIDFDLPPLPPPRTVKGDFAIQQSVQGVEMSNITVVGSLGITCTKPAPTKYSCLFEEGTDSGTITFGNYNSVKTSGAVNDHRVCPEGTVPIDPPASVENLGPINDGTGSETTPYSFALMPDGEFILNIAIKKTNC